eukprot:6174681-Pleurochrysis_carterae.AAC.3
MVSLWRADLCELRRLIFHRDSLILNMNAALRYISGDPTNSARCEYSEAIAWAVLINIVACWD